VENKLASLIIVSLGVGQGN